MSAAFFAGLAITGIVGASAAGLGGIGTPGLGADADIGRSCDATGVDVSYETGYDGSDPANPFFDVRSVNLDNVDAHCNALAYEVVLSDAGAVLTTLSGPSLTVVAGRATLLVPDSVDAENVDGIAILITGNG